MIDRRKFTIVFIKALTVGTLLPVAEMLNACTYNKEELIESDTKGSKKLQLIKPNGGEYFDQVTTLDVFWSSQHIHLLNILISYDEGSSWSSLKKNIDATLFFNKVELPESDIFSDNCLLKVECVEDPNLYDISNQSFSIKKGVLTKSIHLLTPSNNERLVVGRNYTITWEALNVDSFDVQLYIGGAFWGVLATSLTEKFFTWQVSVIDSDDAKIRVVDSANNTISDINSESFKIVSVFEIDLAVHVELQTIGGSKIFDTPEFSTFVVKKITSTVYKAISMVCTHNGCIIGLKTDLSFQCSCHGSAFNSDGAVTNGPASLPLTIFYTEYFSAEQKVLIYN